MNRVRKAVLSIEASVSVTLFLYAVIIMLDLISMYNIRMQVQRAIYNTGTTVSKYYYAYEELSELGDFDVRRLENDGWSGRLTSGAFSATVLKAMVIDELPAGFMKDKHLVGGSSGFNCIFSDVINDSGNIDIVVSYKLKSPFDIFGLSAVKVTNRIKMRAFAGDKLEGSDVKYVYIAPNGVVYHEDINCSYIKVNLKQATVSEMKDLRSDDGSIYYPCKGCCNYYNDSTHVYYTVYGNRFHTSTFCRLIKRGVIRIPLDKVGNRRPCSKCCSK